MSTFTINLNDTIAMSDSTVVKLAEVLSKCQPCETESNCTDVAIALIICATIGLVAHIAKCGFLRWKSEEIKAKENEREFQKTKEEAECNRKQDAEREKRANMLDDEVRKRQYAKEDEERKRQYAKEDEERERKYALEDEERKRKYAKEDKELECENFLEDEG